MAKAVFVIASKNFQDEEFFRPKEILEEAKIEVVPVSNRVGIAKGSEGGEVPINDNLEDLSSIEYEILVWIGGSGALKYLDNDLAYQLLRRAKQQKKIIGAICIAPLILARAGILEGKKATVWTSPLYQKSVKELKRLGVEYVNASVVQDGIIVTANGPAAAGLFGAKLVEVYQDNLAY